jgi:hypothetical protein
MSNHSEAFVAFDTSKLRNAVAIAAGISPPNGWKRTLSHRHDPVARCNPPTRVNLPCPCAALRCQNRALFGVLNIWLKSWQAAA